MAKDEKSTKGVTQVGKVLACSCSHEFQDRQLGKGNRYHTPAKDGYRCTVCGIKKGK